jgi:hypothetical protein
MHIQSAENFLKQLSVAVVTVAAALSGLFGVLLSIKAAAIYCGCLTLVTLKIRLNN